MLPIGFLLIFLCFVSFPAHGAPISPPLTLLPCFAGERGQTPSPPPSPLLPTEPAGHRPRGQVSKEERVRVETGEDLVSLLFLTSSIFTPWLGAGLEEEEGTALPSGYRVGAGFGCDLTPLTRLNLGYRYSSQLDQEWTRPVGDDDTDRHFFTLGVKQSF